MYEKHFVSDKLIFVEFFGTYWAHELTKDLRWNFATFSGIITPAVTVLMIVTSLKLNEL